MTNDQITVDLFADLAEKCRIELQRAGYSVPDGSDEKTIRAYLNVRHQRVPIRPRRIHKVSYSVPPELVVGEQEFLKKVEIGDDLRPHQSTRLEKVAFEDGMLNDFGLQHFHLGTEQHPKNPAFVARTKILLVALVKDDDFYSLGCYEHGCWSKSLLLDLIHQNWPELIDGHSINAIGLQQSFDDSEHQKLRDAGVNVPTQRPGGEIHMGPGGGIALDGSSMKVMMEIIKTRQLCANLEKYLEDTVRKMTDSGQLSPPVSLHLGYRYCESFAEIEGSRDAIPLNEDLYVSQL